MAHSDDEDEVPAMTVVVLDAARDGGCSVVRRYLVLAFGLI